MTRYTLLPLLGVIVGTSWLQAAGAEIIRVWPAYREAESFESIGELMGKGETAGGRILARSKPEDRTGYYFLTRIRTESAAATADVRLEVIMPGSDQPIVHAYAVSLPAGQSVLQLGVTGADWPGARVRPIAWRITVSTPGGEVLARTQSFLWGQP